MTTDASPSAPTDNSGTGTSGLLSRFLREWRRSATEKRRTCDELAKALSDGDMPQMVAAHTKLILQYYEDVQSQAAQSFSSAKLVAIIGFAVLIATLIYTFAAGGHPNTSTVGAVGVASGSLIEFIAGVNFWLYSRAARQFAAFHICLERTHRYLIAYQIAAKIARDRDRTLHNLVCIMANAPMIRLGGTSTDDTGSQLWQALAPAPRREPDPRPAKGSDRKSARG